MTQEHDEAIQSHVGGFSDEEIEDLKEIVNEYERKKHPTHRQKLLDTGLYAYTVYGLTKTGVEDLMTIAKVIKHIRARG